MAILLQIDTTGPISSVSLTQFGALIHTEKEIKPNAHAQVITLLIQKALEKTQIPLNEIKAIALSSGPGSYTGLRIGSSTAKGLCLALEIPLISINTLDSLFEGIQELKPETDFDYFIPVLDARRMEVYLSIFNKSGIKLVDSKAWIIDEKTFEKYLESPSLFWGSGSEKLKSIYSHHPNAFFYPGFETLSSHFTKLAQKKFENSEFENLIDFEPFYLKEFYSTSKIHNS